ncbi:MAG: aminoglycoside phosphotransferase family protein [Roseivirga sp.]
MDIEITLPLVKSLVVQQFPQYAHWPVRAVQPGGIDNRTFRLGDELLIRLPSAEGYAAQVEKEQQWLPKLASCLSVQVPEPIAMGAPSQAYPWNWSIFKWISGDSACSVDIDKLHLEQLAIELAQFLKELHTVDTTNAPPGGLHNYYRGAHVSVYDREVSAHLNQLQGLIKREKALTVWKRAISSAWSPPPVWIHGDFASGNILVKEQQLAAVIDFGCMGIGDPACDLVVAWTFLKDTARALFKSALSLDADTWARARGWALWKAGFELVALKNKTSPKAIEKLAIIDDILREHEKETT